MDALLAILPFVIPAVVLFAVALLVGRWWVLLVPVIGWSLFNLGLIAGWWANGSIP